MPSSPPLPPQWTLVGILSASTCTSSPAGFWPAPLLAGRKFQGITTLQEKPSTNGWWKWVYKCLCPRPHPLAGWLCSPCSMPSLTLLQGTETQSAIAITCLVLYLDWLPSLPFSNLRFSCQYLLGSTCNQALFQVSAPRKIQTKIGSLWNIFLVIFRLTYEVSRMFLFFLYFISNHTRGFSVYLFF